jgi:hypothetical protein
VLFTLRAERCERRSILISSNLVFSQWDQIFKDPLTTMAAIGRLVHHAIILEFDGLSQRARKVGEMAWIQDGGLPRDTLRCVIPIEVEVVPAKEMSGLPRLPWRVLPASFGSSRTEHADTRRGNRLPVGTPFEINGTFFARVGHRFGETESLTMCPPFSRPQPPLPISAVRVPARQVRPRLNTNSAGRHASHPGERENFALLLMARMACEMPEHVFTALPRPPVRPNGCFRGHPPKANS